MKESRPEPQAGLNESTADNSRPGRTRLAVVLKFTPEAEQALAELALTTEEICAVAAFGRQQETGSGWVIQFDPARAPVEFQRLKKLNLTLWIESGYVTKVSVDSNPGKDKEDQ